MDKKAEKSPYESIIDSLHRYKLSNLVFEMKIGIKLLPTSQLDEFSFQSRMTVIAHTLVTQSLTFIAGTVSKPERDNWYNR